MQVEKKIAMKIPVLRRPDKINQNKTKWIFMIKNIEKRSE